MYNTYTQYACMYIRNLLFGISLMFGLEYTPFLSVRPGLFFLFFFWHFIVRAHARVCIV